MENFNTFKLKHLKGTGDFNDDVEKPEINEGIIKAMTLHHHASQYGVHKAIVNDPNSFEKQKMKSKIKMATHKAAILHHAGIE